MRSLLYIYFFIIFFIFFNLRGLKNILLKKKQRRRELINLVCWLVFSSFLILRDRETFVLQVL